MEKTRICLFTAHSPQMGGGAVILRSLIANLPRLSVAWFYIGDETVSGYESGYLGKGFMGGAIAADIFNTWKMLTNRKVAYIDAIVKQLLQIECDKYWIVSHNEGLRIALELARIQSKPVHLSVHDDWAGAICARSIRYKFLAVWAKKLTISTLKAVSSVDVISSAMADYYKQIAGVKSEVCHRYLNEKMIRHTDDITKAEQSTITCGHIGSIYNKTDFIAFLTIFHEFVTDKGKKPMMKMWGCHLTVDDIPPQLRDNINFYPTLPEEEVIPKLATCTFVYAMYPFNKALSLFSATSLPTKLTSYLQAGRPTFGHGPEKSTLATFLTANKLGTMWTSLNKEEGLKDMTAILSATITYQQLNDARKHYFGERNLIIMNQALLDNPD